MHLQLSGGLVDVMVWVTPVSGREPLFEGKHLGTVRHVGEPFKTSEGEYETLVVVQMFASDGARDGELWTLPVSRLKMVDFSDTTTLALITTAIGYRSAVAEEVLATSQKLQHAFAREVRSGITEGLASLGDAANAAANRARGGGGFPAPGGQNPHE